MFPVGKYVYEVGDIHKLYKNFYKFSKKKFFSQSKKKFFSKSFPPAELLPGDIITHITQFWKVRMNWVLLSHTLNHLYLYYRYPHQVIEPDHMTHTLIGLRRISTEVWSQSVRSHMPCDRALNLVQCNVSCWKISFSCTLRGPHLHDHMQSSHMFQAPESLTRSHTCDM